MKASRPKVLLPATFIAGSFLCLLLLALFTSPVSNVGLAIVFFLALLIFLASLGYTITLLQAGKVNRKSRERIAALSIFAVVLLMFRSAGSLSWVGGIILLLIIGGWLFYTSRRS